MTIYEDTALWRQTRVPGGQLVDHEHYMSEAIEMAITAAAAGELPFGAVLVDPDGAVDAANVVNTCTEAELENILSSYGEERMSRAISKAIVRQRPVRTTRELGDLVTRVARGRRGRIHPATRSFQNP